MSRMSRIPALACLAAVSALGACRSDGGFGRRDSARSLAWAADVVCQHQAADVRATAENAEHIGVALRDAVDDPWRGIRRTWILYTEGSPPDN